MRTRTALTTALVGVLAVGSLAPAVAAPKKKPKTITVTYKATALPDPTSTSQVPGSNVQCKPTSPAGKDRREFKAPAAGTLVVKTVKNTGDWSLGLVVGGTQVSTSDGPDVDSQEIVAHTFKKAGAVFIDACNFAGEPMITVTYTFTYK